MSPLSLVIVVSPSAPPCVPSAPPSSETFFFVEFLSSLSLTLLRHVWLAFSSLDWHTLGRWRGWIQVKFYSGGNRDTRVDNRFYFVTSIKATTLFYFPLTAVHREPLITVVWKKGNLLFFSFYCFLCFASLFFSHHLYPHYAVLVCISFCSINCYIHLSGNDNPAPAWRELLMWNQDAHHVPTHQAQKARCVGVPLWFTRDIKDAWL